MKFCPKCNKSKSKGEFYKKNSKRLQSYCKLCFNSYCAERWRQKKIKAIAYMGGHCADCRYNKHPAAFQFHHTRDKLAAWTQMRLWGWDRIHAELAKCILLCANCHSIRHSHY